MTTFLARRDRAAALLTVTALHLLVVLGCAPYLSDTHPEVRTQPVAWQCPTPSPVPTRLLRTEYGGGPPPTPTTEHLVYSTPVPTATPYIRTGSDYFAGQRVQVGPLVLAATSKGYRAGAQMIGITVENPTAYPVELHFNLSLIRVIRRPDGRALEGTWYPSSAAQTAAGLPDPPSLWPPTPRGETIEVTLAVFAPEGQVESWGMPFARDDQRRTGQTGSRYVWWRFVPDPHCGGMAGGPPSDAYNSPAPAGQPVMGRAGWPVPPGTVISRGYGCDPFFTGVRGNCPAGWWWHDGVDWASASGTPLYAVRDLAILYTGPDTGSMDCSEMAGSEPPHTGFGLYIKAQDQAGYTYWYGHTAGFSTRAGAKVTAGQQVARMGSTGCSTGPHLHFRVRLNGLDRNPFDVLQQP